MTDVILATGTLVVWAAALSALAARAERSLGKHGAFLATFVPAVVFVPLASLSSDVPIVSARSAITVVLIVGAVADARTGYVFDCLTLPGALAAITIASHTASSAIGALLTTLPFAIFAVKSWLGWGDVKAIFGLAVAFGLFDSILAIFVASLSGFVYAQARLGHARSSPLAFVPHLAGGAVVAYLFARPVRALMGI